MLHTTEGLAEGQSRSIGGTSTDWGRRGGTGGGPEPKDIKGPAGRTRMAEIYASLDWYNRGQHHSTPQWSEERDAGRMRLDRVEGGDSRRTGPSRTTNQDVPLEAKCR